MAYWENFNWVGSTSPITNLLENEDTTLENILDEDEILSELRNNNESLLQFFSKEETLERLLDYIIKVQPQLDDKLKYRYPYLCSEIICFDSANIYDELINKDLLPKLFSFLDGEPPLDNLLSSYFNRIVSYILNKKLGDVIDCIRGKDNFLERILVHIYSPAISDIIIKLLNCSQADIVDDWFAKEEFISKIITKLNKDEIEEVHENVAEILVSLSETSIQLINCGNDEPKLSKQLNDKSNITEIIKNIFSNPNSSSLKYGGSILVEIANGKKSDILDNTVTFDSLPIIFSSLIENIELIKKSLETYPNEQVILSTGVLSPPFGFCRMKTLEILTCLVSSNFTCVYQKLLDANIFSLLLDIFFQYQWNNFVHSKVTNIVKSILASNQEDIVKQFVEQTKIHDRIGEAGEEPRVNGEFSSRKGFMGHLSSMASCIHAASELDSNLEDILEESKLWKTYMQSDFASTKKQEAANLGGSDDKVDENATIDNLISRFQNITKKSFEDDFPDSFTPSNEEAFDILIHPTDNKLFVGINTDEEDFGNEFDDDDDDFMASDEEDDY